MKSKLTCYIIDDEPLAQKILEAYVSKVPFMELTGCFSSPVEASEMIAKDNPDVLFLDINMPDIDGLTFISMLNPCPIIVLTTAYEQHAVKAYELAVKDYLVKPISFERFYKVALKIYQEQNIPVVKNVEALKQEAQNKDYIFIKAGQRIQKIMVKDILYIEGMKDYLQIHTTEHKFMTLTSFAKLSLMLTSSNFVRVHKSFMIAIDKIDHVEKNRIAIGKQTIPVSDTYRDGFFKLLGDT
jgi:DNA-binding LytR/AlgR family response regulator